MPKVGSKHFRYTPRGRKRARQYARRTNQKVTRSKGHMSKRK